MVVAAVGLERRSTAPQVASTPTLVLAARVAVVVMMMAVQAYSAH